MLSTYPSPGPAEAAPALSVQRFASPHFDISRLRSDSEHFGVLLPPPVDQAYMMAVTLRPLPSCHMTVDGRAMRTGPIPEGGMCLMRSDGDIRLMPEKPFDLFRFYIRDEGFSASLEDSLRVTSLRPPPHGMVDSTIVHLARSLLPALDAPHLAPALFVSHIGLAISVHLAQAYGGGELHRPPGGGRLARWQELRAKERLANHLRGDISMRELAAECGLSPAYFATAFKRTTGSSPTAWLMDQRIARAKGLLALTDTPLAEVALACGFLDQAHFTRHFSRIAGAPPGLWRRTLGRSAA